MADFFNKVKKGFNKGTQVISVKSSTMMETNKLKGEISSQKKEKNDIFTAIGSQVYTMKQAGYIDLSQIEEQLNKLVAIDAAIVEKEAAIEEVLKKQEEALQSLEGQEDPTGKVTCSCGTVLSSGTKFCSKCGKRVEEVPTEIVVEETQEGSAEVVEEPTVRYCECGAELSSDTVFCAQCGRKME